MHLHLVTGCNYVAVGLHALDTAYLNGPRGSTESKWKTFSGFFSPWSDHFRPYLFLPIVLQLIVMGALGYLVARVYLVVEAFISLRSVPASAYRTPDWTQYLLHL